jgi:hypothetical protein
MNRCCTVVLAMLSVVLPLRAQDSPRVIEHFNAETQADKDSTAYQRLIGKVALAIENKVAWSSAKDPKADGEASFEAFKQEFAKINQKKAPADKEAGKQKFDPEQFRTHVANIVSMDVCPYSSTENGQDWRTYTDAFVAAFNSDALPGSNAPESGTAAQINVAGPKPEEDAWTGLPGGHRTEDAVKAIVNDPDSVKFDSCSKPSLTKSQGDSCWTFKVGFRAKNAFGGYVRSVAWIYWRNGEVINANLDD